MNYNSPEKSIISRSQSITIQTEPLLKPVTSRHLKNLAQMAQIIEISMFKHHRLAQMELNLRKLLKHQNSERLC